MAKYVSTKTASGGSSGGGSAGLSAADVCNQICKLSTNATGSPGAAAYAADTTLQTTEISGGFSKWKMICNCPCWTDCYGCQVIWNFDTTRYRGFKLVYTGMRACSCCYTYFCPGIGTAECFCCCSNTFNGSCICCWPQKSCCCWDAYNCCAMLKEACIYCCNAAQDDLWGFEWTVWAPCDAWGCPAQGRGVMWDWRYKKFMRSNWDNYGYASRDRQMGITYCSCLFWSACQNSTYAFTRLCIEMGNAPFQSALVSGNYNSDSGGACGAGQPCWTIWGIPCFRPEFGTCSMTTS